MIKNKLASTAVGGGIIIVAVLLLLGAIILEFESSTSGSNQQPGTQVQGFEELFVLERVELGRQQRITQSFPNIELGSRETFHILYMDSNIELVANPFTSNNREFLLQFENRENVRSLLIYFDPNRISGNQRLIFRIDGEEVLRTTARAGQIPLRTNLIPFEDQVTMNVELDKPSWYRLFNWNKFEINDFRVVEVRQNIRNFNREFNFNVNTDFIEEAFVNLVISCDRVSDFSEPIKVTVNGFIVANENPQCLSNDNVITAQIPLNILRDENNLLELETRGFYHLAYSINTIHFNDQNSYRFTISNFNSILDVVMYGNFDKEVIDIRLNGQILSLNRNEIRSIIQYLRFGTNELVFLTKPVNIESFKIEKTEFFTR